jgi:hypothetical protein
VTKEKYTDWSNEQLNLRYSLVTKQYIDISNEIIPKLEKLSKLELEIFEVALELKNRGSKIEKENA